MTKTALMAAVAAAATGMSALSAQAQTYNWLGTEGTFNWDFPENWSQPDPGNPSYPNAAGVVANVNTDLVNAQTITIPGSMPIVGVINLGDSGAAPDSKFTLGTATGGAGTLIFDNGANDAQLNVTKDINPAAILTDFDQLGTNLVLNSNLAITANGTTTGSIVQIRGKISDGVNGPKGLIINGPHWVELRSGGEANDFTGTTVVNGGRLRLMSGSSINLIVGDILVNAGATVQDGFGNGNVIGNNSMITLAGGFYNPGGGSDTIGGLQGSAGEAGGGAGTISFGANNLDAVFDGSFTSSTSWTKVGTGVQTLGGTGHNLQSSGSRNFRVHDGRVDLNKTAGVVAIAQTNVFVGDGTLSGVNRPELRHLQSDQIGVVSSSTGTPTETNIVTLNSGILNLNNNNETLGTLVASGTGISTIDHGATGKLSVVTSTTVNDGATAEFKAGAANALNAGATLTIAPTGKLDLKDNKLVTGSPAGTATAGVYDGVQGQVQRASNAGAWDGAGLTTTMPDAAGGLTTIGVATGAQIRGLGPTDTDTFAGQTITGASTIAMYTYAGDANLDGAITGDDYSVIDFNIAVPGADGYYNGDFNYDGIISGDDYSVIDFNIHAQGAPFSTGGSAVEGVTAVPEPASACGLAVLAAGLFGRRRRRSM